MPRYILVAIDGTGSMTWGRDARGGRGVNGRSSVIVNSHVNMFYHDFDPLGGDKIYLHGPSNHTSGSDSTQIMANARAFIHSTLRRLLPALVMYDGPIIMAAGSRDTREEDINRTIRTSDVEFVFVGHSRGGAMIIEIAHSLEKAVQFMGLYDAVDRSAYIDNTDVITNVRTCYHARRDAGMVSRPSFENCGTRILGGTYRESFFQTAHGGVGGDETSGGGMFDDYSCQISSSRIYGYNEILGGVSYITNSIISGRDTAVVCREESVAANTFVRNGARGSNITLRGR